MKHNLSKLYFIIAICLLMAFGKKPLNEIAIRVAGNCEQCKIRIEKATKLDGVKKASWSSESQMLTVHFDSTVVSIEAIEKAIASVGHDTENFIADSLVYKQLPYCCQYRP